MPCHLLKSVASLAKSSLFTIQVVTLVVPYFGYSTMERAVKPGELVKVGDRFGMIKFGSRTELVLPDEPGLEIVAQIGEAVKGGTTIMAKYPQT